MWLALPLPLTSHVWPATSLFQCSNDMDFLDLTSSQETTLLSDIQTVINSENQVLSATLEVKCSKTDFYQSFWEAATILFPEFRSTHSQPLFILYRTRVDNNFVPILWNYVCYKLVQLGWVINLCPYLAVVVLEFCWVIKQLFHCNSGNSHTYCPSNSSSGRPQHLGAIVLNVPRMAMK